MKNKGFALIAIPAVNSIIIQARKNAFLSTANGVLEAGEIYFSKKLLHTVPLKDALFEFPNANDLEIKGALPTSGKMKITIDGKIKLAVSNGKYCARKDYEEDEIKIDDDITNCNLIYEDSILNGALPELKTGMIPITIEANGVVRKANIYDKWYKYDEKKWANAVMVNSTSRKKYMKAKAGTIIEESDILTYFVWVPRYKYKLWHTEKIDSFTTLNTTLVHHIDIVFESKNTIKSLGTENGEYLTHPAFTLNSELNGFWVGKFETGYNGASTIEETKKVGIFPSKVIIKPTIGNKIVYSWLGNNISNMYYSALKMNESNNVYGLTTDSIPHMMKNTEWGATAYLAHSIYGTCSSEKCGEIYLNNNNQFMTGCGADSSNESQTNECKNKYGSKINDEYHQSTTQNITGIFDMSGGTYELVMAFSTSGSSSYDKSGFTEETFPKQEYIDIYATTTSKQYSKRILGDATGELGPFSSYKSSWYNDYSYFLYTKNPWLGRGGFYSQGINAGIFSFGNSLGDAYSTGSTFRIVIS